MTRAGASITAGTRPAELGVVVPAVVGGLLFAPVFTLRTLVVPVLLVALVVLAVAEVTRRRPGLARWRAGLALTAGALALAEVTLRPTLVAGVVPTAATVRGFAGGALHGWRRALETSWPAPGAAGHALFVPLLVLVAAVIGVELLARHPLPALVPGLAVVAASQTFAAARGVAALAAGLACAGGAAAVLLGTSRRGAAPTVGRDFRASGRLRSSVTAVATLAGVLVAGALAGAALDPAGRSAYALSRRAPATRPVVATNPLDEIGARLRHPDSVVFTDRTSTPVDRWLLAVFDRFDGANWSASPQLLRLGAALPRDPDVTAPLHRGTASVQLVDLAPVWLPTQSRTLDVSGAAPLVDPASGALLAAGAVQHYSLHWTSPRVSAGRLVHASLAAAGASDLGEVPAGFARIARAAVGGVPPSFRAALLLESYLRTHYRVAVGTDLPTGHGYPQLEYFLTTSRRGTSEQVAAAYVVLARQLGIAARLAVGFRQPSQPGPDGTYVVRNADAFAWPEIAVAGVGWVPLDPTGTAPAASAAGPNALAAATAQARRQLPPHEPARRTAVPLAGPATTTDAGSIEWWPALAAAVLACLLAVPLAKAVRGRIRRQRGSAPAQTVAAWHEARDRLRDYGVVASRAMTVRDLAADAGVPGLGSLAGCVDRALWAGEAVPPEVADEAWAAVLLVRRALRRRPFTARLRAALDARSLLAPPRRTPVPVPVPVPELIGAAR